MKKYTHPIFVLGAMLLFPLSAAAQEDTTTPEEATANALAASTAADAEAAPVAPEKLDTMPDAATEAAKGQVEANKPTDDAVTEADATTAGDKATGLRAQADAAVKAAEAAEAEALRLDTIVKRRGFWWNKNLQVGLTGSLLFSDQFVGQTDGWTAQAGLLVSGGINFGYNGLEVRSTGRVNESLVSTPAIGSWAFDDFEPVFLKAADVVEWESLALYAFPAFPYVGPYARVKASTQALPGWSYFSQPTDVKVTDNVIGGAAADSEPCSGRGVANADGSRTCGFQGGKNATRLNLTNIFEPMILEQGLGAIILPPSFPPWVDYNFSVGVGAREIIARDFFFRENQGGFIVQDDPDTPDLVEVIQLKSNASVGAEAKAQFSGSLTERVAWNLGASFYYPIASYNQTQGIFIAPGDTNTQNIGLFGQSFDNAIVGPLHADLEGLISLKLTDWFSVNWSNRLRREPYILTNFQFQSQVLASIGYTAF